MTPNSIEVLIHCHCSPRQHPRFDAPAIQDALHELESDGLIVKTTNADRNTYDDGTYKTTDRGSAHIEQLCQTPYPVELWCTVHGEVISPNNGLHSIENAHITALHNILDELKKDGERYTTQCYFGRTPGSPLIKHK